LIDQDANSKMAKIFVQGAMMDAKGVVLVLACPWVGRS
jgi:hypothetical protein